MSANNYFSSLSTQGITPFYGYHLLQVDSYLFIRISSSLSRLRSPAVYIYISTSAKQAWQTHIAKGQPWPHFIFILPPRRPDGLDLMQKFLTWWQKALSGREARKKRGGRETEWGRKHRGRAGEGGGMVRAGWLSMYLSFQVSVHHSGRRDGFMASEIHPWQGGLHSEYKYMCVCHGQGHSWQANSC